MALPAHWYDVLRLHYETGTLEAVDHCRTLWGGMANSMTHANIRTPIGGLLVLFRRASCAEGLDSLPIQWPLIERKKPRG